MNPKVKALWTAALRSGEYQQTTGTLRSVLDGKSSYCCLGVLTELAVAAGVIEPGVTTLAGVRTRYDWRQIVERSTAALDMSTTSTLPRPVMEWADLSTDDACFALSGDGTIDGAYTLVDLNDHARYTFEQIADVIDERF